MSPISAWIHLRHSVPTFTFRTGSKLVSLVSSLAPSASFLGRAVNEHDLIGTLRSHKVAAEKTSLKSEFTLFQSSSWLFLPTFFVKCRRTLPRTVSNMSLEREIIRFHHLLLCTKKCDTRAKLLFCLLNLLFFFLTFALPSRRPILRRLVQTYPDIFERGDFFLRFQNNTHPHVAYSNRFRPSTQKRKNDGKTIASLIEHASC